MFVLAIDVVPVDRAPERIEWRFSYDYEVAESEWYRVQALAELGYVVRTDRGKVTVLAARLYETTSADRAIARELVLAGQAKPLKDTDNFLIGLSDEESRALNEII